MYGFGFLGNKGSGRAVVKAVPIAILHPMVGATGAISKTLLGLRHTLDPFASNNDEDKYKRSTGN
jgi:autophagy-related protein 2